jgi:hypothetical protein
LAQEGASNTYSFDPADIAGQAIAGEILVGSLLEGQGGSDPLSAVLVFASGVATAELLAILARLDTPW